MGFEERLLAGDPRGFSLADIGLAEQTSRCALSLRSTDDGYIRCTLRGNAHVDGYTITVVRTNGGGWHCEVDPAISPSYRPSGCR
ncbi:pilin [Lysobacter sp. GX 14042]|nr:pilin [Lysobacter sp. GX 14042]